MSTKDYLEKDYYKVLGVSKTASQDEIKQSYRKLARANHPDANKGDPKSEERFKEISEAYNVLSDEKRRKEYDNARSLFGGSYRPGGGTGPGGFDLGDLFGQPGGTAGPAGGERLSDLFGGLFGGRGRTATRSRRGADIETETRLTFAEAATGATRSFKLSSDAACPTCKGTGAKAGTSPRVCPECSGTGHENQNLGGFSLSEPCSECRGRGLVVDDPCPTCNGSGRGTSTRTIQARIPGGVSDGQRIRLKGKGAPGEHGGPAGDLYVVVHVQPHPLFGKSGDNLTITVPVTFPEAVLGAEVRVPTLNGLPVTVKIPPGTPNGRTFRVRGKGATRRDGTTGDLLVTVEVSVPQSLSGEAREALEKFRAATADQDPRSGLEARAKGV
ncbi:molecular chaperone DnaJ [Streptomonospora nanhaiensis]|uniref:molecular chaperone DnaJ n=1 Tax=Streptomonospora nanhaiensis TaxID=1323731 RepID=UPI001C3848AA|nr:molecular chaperone DnaJ [Streptomonospora nanhaiensis]MBV2365133.1 molecular chaperone DnaJ [Streptomonospora nanhaiensis]MBX9387781.1 molecular chaperone DnaJ [Streptomonospora nanhaiensis]